MNPAALKLTVSDDIESQTENVPERRNESDHGTGNSVESSPWAATAATTSLDPGSLEPPSSIDFKDQHLTIEELHQRDCRYPGVSSSHNTFSLEPPDTINFKDQALTIEEICHRDSGYEQYEIEPRTVIAHPVHPEEFDPFGYDNYGGGGDWIPIANAIPIRPPRRKRQHSQSTSENTDDSFSPASFHDELPQSIKTTRRRPLSCCCLWIIGALVFCIGGVFGMLIGVFEVFPIDKKEDNNNIFASDVDATTSVPTDAMTVALTDALAPTDATTISPTTISSITSAPTQSPTAEITTVPSTQSPTMPLPTPPPLSSWTKVGQTLYGAEAFDEWGEFLELSGDGHRLAVGCEEYGENVGRVAIFSLDEDAQSWIQLGDDIVGDVENGEAGKVAISADGDTVAIGSINKDPTTGQDSGFVRLFRYNSTSNNWKQIGPIISGESPSDRFGSSVALNANGTIVASGGTGDDDEAKNAGQARVFRYNAEKDEWKQMGQDVDGPEEKNYFGADVTLSADGLTLGVGGYGNDFNGERAGLARVYTFNQEFSIWVQLGQDLTGEAAGDEVGNSISLSDDGRIVALGSLKHDANGIDSGRVRVFKYRKDRWVQLGQSIDGEAEGDRFGRSVALSGDGLVLAAGGYFNDAAGDSAGQVRAFRYNMTLDEWEQIGPAMNGDAERDWFGEQVTISKDGRFVASGGSFHNGPNGERSGNVKVFTLQ